MLINTKIFWDNHSSLTENVRIAFFKTHEILTNMNHAGNCYDNAVTETFFGLLKPERVKRGSIQHEPGRGSIFVITLKDFIIGSAVIRSTRVCHQRYLRKDNEGVFFNLPVKLQEGPLTLPKKKTIIFS